MPNKLCNNNDDKYKKNYFMDTNRDKDNLIFDYFNLENQRHLVKDTKISNYNKIFNANNSINSNKYSSLKKGILIKSNNKSESISQYFENSNNQDDFKLVNNKILMSSKKASKAISIKNKNKEKFIIFDVIDENIQ